MKSHEFNLNLGNSESTINTPLGESVNLSIDAFQLSKKHFKENRPSDLELEYAIAEIEDHVMPLDKTLPSDRKTLHVSIQIPRIPNIFPMDQAMDLDAFEALFNRAISTSNPKEWIAALLIIRECSHHLRFQYVDISTHTMSQP